ncbi:UNVERIFIED_CONTAM: hypothetical protein FKN15_037645 [Acipenser sinensis]
MDQGLDGCLTYLKEEEWCFTCTEPGHSTVCCLIHDPPSAVFAGENGGRSVVPALQVGGGLVPQGKNSTPATCPKEEEGEERPFSEEGEGAQASSTHEGAAQASSTHKRGTRASSTHEWEHELPTPSRETWDWLLDPENLNKTNVF